VLPGVILNRLRKKGLSGRHRFDSLRPLRQLGYRRMRGTDQQTSQLFSYLSPEQMVPQDHPLRVIRPLANAALDRLSPEFSKLYSAIGRPSIPPEQLLRALLLQAFFTVRSERQLMEQLTYNMMFRWFVGLSMDAPVWDVTVFTKNRDRLLEGDVAAAFLRALLAEPQVKPLLSNDHFSVDGTLIEACASMKSFRPKDGSGELPADGRNGERDFHGEKRSNDTHASTTDLDARLYKKAAGQASKLCHMAHVVMENQNGLVVAATTTQATGTAERDAAIAMMDELNGGHRITLGADKAYDTTDFVAEMRRQGVTPHVTQNNKRRRSAIDGRTTRHAGYAVSQRIRKRIEEVFGWMKTVGGQRKTRYRGTAKVGWMFTLSAAAYNLIRMPKLLGVAA
jgi:transposase